VTGYLAGYEPAMRLALEQAAAGPAGRPGAAAEVPVGAVVLGPDGAVLAAGRNRREADADPTAHAEIVALRAAGRATGSWRLVNCTLVVTLEPCTMCAGAVLAARLGRLVYGAADARAGAAGSLWDVLHDRRLGPPPEVITGVLAADCADLLRDFFARIRAG
jgi:tRNA(adenine34) deaminase